tara:strand:- start:796 stop:1008 length:213 start_codon:yes stop_codon:yes gene_type:complete
MKTVNYTFRIVCDTEDAPNPVHLCEEIQCYLNANKSDYMMIHDDENLGAEVVGYNVEHDNITPFIAQEEY